jgi:signal transduction histidine kinase
MVCTVQQPKRYPLQVFVEAFKARRRMHFLEIIWPAAFYVILVITDITTCIQTPANLGPILLFSTALALWYALCIGIPEQTWSTHWLLTIFYFGVEWIIWLKLVEIDTGFYFMLWGFYPQISICLGIRDSIIASLSLGAIGVLFNVIHNQNFDLTIIVYNFIGAGMSIMFHIFIEAILRESHERKRLIEKLEATRSELAAAERQAGILGERQRLGREIHDTLAQGFTSIVLHLEAAEGSLPPEFTTTHHHLDQARQTARDSLAEARRLVWALRPESLARASLSEALGRVTERWSEESGLVARATVTGTPRPLRPEIEVTLLRVAQEALANIRKHAQASQVILTLSYMEDMVSLDVLDNGVGFDAETIAERCARMTESGFGLRGMRERIAELGGTLLIESTPSEGTTLAISVPAVDVPEPVLIVPVRETVQ